MKKSLTAAIIGAAFVSACAQSPEAIQPVSMGNAFARVSCSDARAMLAAERQALGGLSSAQRAAVAGDAIGVFLIGVPTSSLTGGDRAGDIAATKGKILALEARLSGC